MLYYTVVQIQLSDGNFKHQDQKKSRNREQTFSSLKKTAI